MYLNSAYPFVIFTSFCETPLILNNTFPLCALFLFSSIGVAVIVTVSFIFDVIFDSDSVVFSCFSVSVAFSVAIFTFDVPLLITFTV